MLSKAELGLGVWYGLQRFLFKVILGVFFGRGAYICKFYICVLPICGIERHILLSLRKDGCHKVFRHVVAEPTSCTLSKFSLDDKYQSKLHMLSAILYQLHATCYCS